MAFSLQEALQQLRSERIKDRQQGLESLEHIFSDPDVVLQLDARRDGKPWLKTFQSLFACVLSEKLTCVKKGSWRDAQSTSLARLQRAAQMLRSLVEKAVSLLPQRVIKALVTHIVQMMDFNGTMFEPVTKAYIPALASILHYSHHVDHLEEHDWVATATLCLNALLARDLFTELSHNSTGSAQPFVSSSMIPPAKAVRSLSLEDAGLATCLQYLLISDMAPLLGNESYGITVLHNYTEFFVTYTTESSAHLPALRGLVRLVSELELNATQDVILSALKTKATIMSLWSTKNRPLKVQVLLYLRIVVPLLISCTSSKFELFGGPLASQSSLKVQAHAYTEGVHRMLLLDADSRWGFEPLHMSRLVLRRPNSRASSTKQLDTSFHNGYFAANLHFLEQDALAWTKLELQVEILVHLASSSYRNSTTGEKTAPTSSGCDSETDSAGSSPPSAQKRKGSPLKAASQKRTKLTGHKSNSSGHDTCLTELVHRAANVALSSPVRSWCVQLLVFLAVQAWPELDQGSADLLLDSVTSLVADLSAEVSAWSMIATAAIICQNGTGRSSRSSTTKSIAPVLGQTWSFACKNLSSASLGRASAYLMNVMILGQVLPENKVFADVHLLFKELDLQFPGLVCDSICHLFSTLLQTTTSKVSFQNQYPRRKLCDWIMSNVCLGSPLSNHGQYTPLEDILHLITQVIASHASFPTGQYSPSQTILEGDLETLHEQRRRLESLRKLVLSADSNDSVGAPATRDRFIDSDCGSFSHPVSLDENHRIIGWLQKHVNLCINKIREESSISIESSQMLPLGDSNLERLGGAVQLAILGLVVASTSSVAITQLCRTSSELLSLTLEMALTSRFLDMAERTQVFQEILTLTLSQSVGVTTNDNCFPLLVLPGPNSGIARPSSENVAQKTEQRDTHDAIDLKVWKMVRTAGYLQQISDCVANYSELATYHSAKSLNDQDTRELADDFEDFGRLRQKISTSALHNRGAKRACKRYLEISLRLTTCLQIGIASRLAADDKPIHNEELVKGLSDSPIHSFMPMAPVLLKLFAEGRLWISQSDISVILERFGNDVLGAYQYARDPSFRLSALRAITSILPFVRSLQDDPSDLFDKVDKLARFLVEQACRSKRRSGWTVRIACAQLVGRCLALDMNENFWLEPSQSTGSKSLSNALLKLNCDDDIRVRSFVSPISASLFASQRLDESGTTELYETFRQSLPINSDNSQQILTRALSLSNVAICNSTVRRVALFHLIEIVLAFGGLPNVIRHLFATVAKTLGFTDSASFFGEFASELTWGMIVNDYDPLQLPWKVLGFRNKRTCLDYKFAAFGGMLLASHTDQGQARFETLSQLTRRDLSHSLQECLPFLAALHLGFSVQSTSAENGKISYDKISEATINSLTSIGFSNSDDLLRTSLTSVLDLVVTALLTQYYEPGKDFQGACKAAVETIRARDASCANTLERLLPKTDYTTCRIHEPCQPFFSTAVVYDGIRSLQSLGIDVLHSDAAFSVLQHIFNRISSSHFVSSQIRLFGALQLYLAMCGNAVWKDLLNVRVILRSITSLLDRLHLQAILRPLTEEACRAGARAADLSSDLIHCLLAWALLPSRSVPVGGSVEENLSQSDAWLLESASQLSHTSASSLSTLVLLWPRAFKGPEYVAIERTLSIESVATALEVCRGIMLTLTSLNRIGSIFRRASRRQITSFCRTSGRQLMVWLSMTGSSIRGTDCTDVIGEIIAIVSDHHDAFTSSNLQVKTVFDSRDGMRATLIASSSDKWLAFQAATMISVLDQSHSASLQRSYRAFVCLRGMVRHLTPCTSKGSIKYPVEIKKELARFRFSPVSERTAAGRSTTGELASEELVATAKTYEVWICKCSSMLCDLLIVHPEDAAFSWLRDLVAEDSKIARELLGQVLLSFTASEPEGHLRDSQTTEGLFRPQITARRKHLANCRELISLHFADVLKSEKSDPECWKTIIQALLSVRECRGLTADADSSSMWFNVDSLLLARRCIECDFYTASVFFIEQDAPVGTDVQSPLSQQALNLLHKAYANVSDPDAFYGITQGHVQDLLIRRLHHEGQWQRAFEYHAAEFEAYQSDTSGSRLAASGIGQSLTKLGYFRLSGALDGMANSLRTEFDDTWTSPTWDLPTSSSLLLSDEVAASDVLRALHQLNSEEDVDRPLARAFESTTRSLGSVSTECVVSFKESLGNLLVLRQIKDWRNAASHLGTDEAVAHFRTSWAHKYLSSDYVLSEKVLMARQSILRAARQRKQSGEIGDIMSLAAEETAKLERLVLVAISSRARGHGKLQAAVNATARAQMLEKELADKANIAQEEFAAVLWEQQEPSSAIQLLSDISNSLSVTSDSNPEERRRKAEILVTLAQWRATARSQHPREIDKQLFEPALLLTSTPVVSPEHDLSTEQSKVAYKWARFAEAHYRSSNVAGIARLELYIERRQAEINQNQQEYDRCTSRTEKNQLLQFQRQAEKILRQDKTHLQDLEVSRNLFLRRSMIMYARSLTTSDNHADAVARLISLWFEFSGDAELNELLSSHLQSIPSRKFLSLMHQLSARLSDDQAGHNSFQTNLSNLLLRLCRHHPFHTMYAIFALIKTGADSSSSSGRAPMGTSPLPQVLRSTAAEKIWNQVKKQPALSKRIRIFEEVCLAYVEWAEYNLSSRADRYFQANGVVKKGALRMPPQSELKLSRLRNVDVPVATAELEIDHTCTYASFVSLVRYSDAFSTAGGIHLPKISECTGSDGRRYKQLFKRDDDLRQDAVMQQVFRLVNELLAQDRKTRERRLLVRTYSVIPLGPQCGLLEFVVNTTPLGEVLVAMHTKYRPNDFTPSQARIKLRESQSLAAADKLDAFSNVCERMQPAMRYFFTETQKSPQHWFGTRLNYTRSVATNSIVGHLLGLGDRHVSNILLDKQGGELVHIDFGVAFDQGKLLPIPELVPFRLTRDLVDGMGMNGVEGTFRRCCEETLRVLRAHQDVIRTVLEVFKYDPLFAWTSNPIKVLRAQEADAESLVATSSMERSGSNADLVSWANVRGASRRAAAEMDTAELSADRAITSVMTKLSSTLSVEYTVNDLIQQAMDAGNLSAIFHGWQAAL